MRWLQAKEYKHYVVWSQTIVVLRFRLVFKITEAPPSLSHLQLLVFVLQIATLNETFVNNDAGEIGVKKEDERRTYHRDRAFNCVWFWLENLKREKEQLNCHATKKARRGKNVWKALRRWKMSNTKLLYMYIIVRREYGSQLRRIRHFNF